MASENLRTLIERIQADPHLLATFQAADSAEAVIALAAELGIEIGPDDLGSAESEGSLSESELGLVAGGFFGWKYPNRTPPLL